MNTAFRRTVSQRATACDDGLRESYGHASIVDPWGIVIDQVESGVGMAIADIDLERLADVRRKMPIASHRRL